MGRCVCSGTDEAAKAFYLRSDSVRLHGRRGVGFGRRGVAALLACGLGIEPREAWMFHCLSPPLLSDEDTISPADASREDQLYVFYFYLV